MSVTLPIKKGVRNYFHNITAMYTYYIQGEESGRKFYFLPTPQCLGEE